MTRNQKRSRTIRRWLRQAEARRKRTFINSCQNMTVYDLKAKAKKMGLSGYSKMRKQEIIALIVSSR